MLCIYYVILLNPLFIIIILIYSNTIIPMTREACASRTGCLYIWCHNMISSMFETSLPPSVQGNAPRERRACANWHDDTAISQHPRISLPSGEGGRNPGLLNVEQVARLPCLNRAATAGIWASKTLNFKRAPADSATSYAGGQIPWNCYLYRSISGC